MDEIKARIAAFASSAAAMTAVAIVSDNIDKNKIPKNKIPVVYHEKKKGADYKRRALKWFTHQ